MRPEGWEGRLARLLMKAHGERFAWGVHDCGTVAARVVQLLRGHDVSEYFDGHYEDQESYEAWAKLEGGLDKVTEAIAKRYGIEEINPRLAQRGDIVFVDRPGGGALGVIGMNGMIQITGPKGASYLQPKRASRAWRL